MLVSLGDYIAFTEGLTRLGILISRSTVAVWRQFSGLARKRC
ncbi:MAG: hypothetical protein QOE56_1918 [Solirubrobacterales bacterium]|jgi:hypothetical protein|nr:hypothetical protein [Solirubrobacterales bacterium]